MACSSAHQAKQDWQRVTARDMYGMQLPPSFQRSFDMHPYATLQYYDLERSIFLLGIEDAKENLGDIKRRRLKLGGYFSFVEDIVLEEVQTFRREATQEFPLPGLYGFQVRVRDYEVIHEPWAPFPLYYRIAVYECEEYFFQVVIWMPYEGHCAYYDEIERITQSFVLGKEAISEGPLSQR